LLLGDEAIGRRELGENGEYFSDCNVKSSSALGRDPSLAAKLWQTTERILEDL